MPKLCLIALGCPKNTVEAEGMAGLLSSRGITLTTDIAAADYALVHTCSFINDARDESSRAIRALSRLKEEGKLEKIFVTGCLVQQEGKKIAELFPTVDGFIGTGELDKLPGLIRGGPRILCGKAGGLLDPGAPRLLSSSLPSAYLRLAEGCNHRCGFCLIPRLRGKYVSRPEGSILREAEELAECGIEELNLIAQDTTYYGYDRQARFGLPSLIRKLAKIRGIRWIRLLYAYPSTVSTELLKVIADEEKLCKYIDIPLQHVSGNVLERMRRPRNARETVRRITGAVPGISLRTTMIVGYPGETEKDIAELADFVSEGWFEHLGVFEYSHHPDAPSARLGGQVPAGAKRERRREVMAAQKKAVRKKNLSRVGKTYDVLVESRNGGTWSGRTVFQAPEIDEKTLFSGKAKIGAFVPVTITGTTGYDLNGKQT